jgi:hypothetical protein
LALKTGDVDRITRATDNYARALGRQSDAQRDASKTLRSLTNDMDNAGSAGKQLNTVIQDIGTAAFKTGRGLGTMLAGPAIFGLMEIGRTALTATQSLWLLPAAAAAAGAGMGTLSLATAGFSDTIKDIRDPEKFAEAIQALSPAAQQAALTIRNLLPEFDALKNATQDAFFDRLGAQIERLSTAYLPSIQRLTVGIADSFNQMMTGVSNQSMTPDTTAAMQQTFNNIGTFFQNLVPAAQSLTQALTDITSVGSSFLPGLAADISSAAANFASFIRQASESGKLDEWIQQGIDAVKILGQLVWDLGQIVYRVFGPDGQATINEFRDSLKTISEILGLLMLDTQTWSASWKEELDSMHGPLGSLRDGIMDIPEAFAFVANKAIDMANTVKHALDEMATNATNVVNFLNPFSDDKPFVPLPDISRIDTGWANDWGGHRMPSAVDQPFGPGNNAAQRQHEMRGTPVPMPVGVPGAPWGGPYGVPAAPSPGGKPSDRERRDALIAGLPESAWRVDPYAGIPGYTPGMANGMPSAPGGKVPIGGIRQGYNEFGQPIGPGGNVVDPQKIEDADWAVRNTAHDFEEAQKELLALQADNLASAEEIYDARWRATEKERAWHKAQRELIDAQNGTFKELENSTSGLTDGMGEIGAALDKDLGISKGLAGMADNLVRFIASLAAAPLMGKLAAIQDADPRKGGHGLLGIMGAQGAFGPDFTGLPAMDATTGGSTSPSMYSPSMAGLGPPPFAGSKLVDTGSNPSNPNAQSAAAYLSQMFPGITTIGGSANRPPGTPQGHTKGIALDIMIGEVNAQNQAMGDQINEFLRANKDALGVESTIWRDTWADFSGNQSSEPGHQDHVHAQFSDAPGMGVPTGAIPGMAGTTGASFAGGSIPIPLPVTIVGGGAGGGGGSAPGGWWGPGNQATASGIQTPSDLSQGAESWRSTVEDVVDKYGPQVGVTPNNRQSWVDAIVEQIDTESGGNPGAMNPNDSNGRGGTQSVAGLLQYLPSSYAASGGKLTGLPYMDPVGQIAGALFAPRNADGTPSGIGNGVGWGPDFNTPINQSANATTGGSTALPSLPGVLPGFGGGGSQMPGTGMPQTRGPLGAPAPGAPGQKQYGGGAPPAPNPGGGGVGMTPGGTLETAMNLGAGALDVLAPGAGQAAATGMKLANRAIQYAGQVAGIGVSGLMETFLPTGASDLAANSWFSRIAGGLAGAAPALPNIAGGKGEEAPPLTPADAAQQGVDARAGNKVDINYTHNGAKEDPAIADLTYLQEHSYSAPGAR